MGVEVNSLENEADQILAQSVESFFEEESQDEKVEEPKEEVTDVVIEDTDNNEEVEETESETEELSEEDVEETEEVEDDKEIDEGKLDDLDKIRSSLRKDHVEFLESISDLELKNQIVKMTIEQRSDLDRKRKQYGDARKLVESLDEAVRMNGLNYNKEQYADIVKNFMNFDALFAKDPKQAIETLARTANIDLNTLGGNPVQEVKQDDGYDDDYRTPEEIKRDQEIETLKQELNLLKNHKQQEEQITVQQEINSFANTRDEAGNLKYPHFERVKQSMGLFFNDSNPDMTLEKAYHKAIRLDDELFEQEKMAIEKKAELKRKAEIEKAKKLKKQAVRSSRVSATSTNPDVALRQVVDQFFG